MTIAPADQNTASALAQAQAKAVAQAKSAARPDNVMAETQQKAQDHGRQVAQSAPAAQAAQAASQGKGQILDVLA